MVLRIAKNEAKKYYVIFVGYSRNFGRVHIYLFIYLFINVHSIYVIVVVVFFSLFFSLLYVANVSLKKWNWSISSSQERGM